MSAVLWFTFGMVAYRTIVVPLVRAFDRMVADAFREPIIDE